MGNTLNAAQNAPAAAPKRGRGKPTKYTPELAAAIVDDIRRGVPVTKAYVGNSIGQATGYDWTYTRPDFAAAVQSARGHFRRMQGIKAYLSGLRGTISTQAAAS